MKVTVRYIDGTEEEFPGVDYTAVKDGAYYMWEKTYKGVPADNTRTHIASIPLTAMCKWKEEL